MISYWIGLYLHICRISRFRLVMKNPAVILQVSLWCININVRELEIIIGWEESCKILKHFGRCQKYPKNIHGLWEIVVRVNSVFPRQTESTKVIRYKHFNNKKDKLLFPLELRRCMRSYVLNLPIRHFNKITIIFLISIYFIIFIRQL